MGILVVGLKVVDSSDISYILVNQSSEGRFNKDAINRAINDALHDPELVDGRYIENQERHTETVLGESPVQGVATLIWEIHNADYSNLAELVCKKLKATHDSFLYSNLETTRSLLKYYHARTNDPFSALGGIAHFVTIDEMTWG